MKLSRRAKNQKRATPKSEGERTARGRLQRLVRPAASPAECVGCLIHIVEGFKSFIDLYATQPIRVCNVPAHETMEHIDATTLLSALKARPDLRKALESKLMMLGNTIFAPRVEAEHRSAVTA